MEVIALVFVLAVLAGVTAIVLSFERETFHTSGNPIDIRLIAVRPDAGDDVYDVTGKRIGERFFDGDNLTTWGSNVLRRDFIFELPPGARLQPVSYKIQAEHNNYFVTSGNFWNTDLTNRRTFSVSTTFADTFWRNSMFFGSPQPVEYVDVVLGFYLPNRGQPAVGFKAPFANGVTNKAEWGSELSFNGETVASGITNARFHFSTTLLTLNYISLVFLDRSGTAHVANITSNRSDGRSLTWDGNVPALARSEIAAVEIYLPQEKTFHHVRVRDHEHFPRSYPEANDKLAAIVGTNVFRPMPAARPQSAPMPSPFSFTNATQALAAIHVVRGSYLVQNAWNAISSAKPRVDFSKLPAPEQKRIRKTAQAWSSADDPSVRRCGEELQRALTGAVESRKRN